MRIKTLLSIAALSFTCHAFAANQVSFLEPKDGADVTNPVKVRFGVEGMKIGPLGDLTPNTGHHHLIIGDKGVTKGESVPFDDKHLHFGKGQTETEVTLPPGEHHLTLQFANGAHQSYGPEMSKTIHVHVVDAPKK
ncbi:MAG: DUF4399 domain-containing protein [Pseudomonadota bacterium]